MNENRHSDDEILNGVRRRLAGAEPLIPQPPALGPAFTEPRPGRARGWLCAAGSDCGGFAPLALVAALVVVVAGVGVGSQAFNGNGPGDAGSVARDRRVAQHPGFGLSYQLVHPAGTRSDPSRTGCDEGGPRSSAPSPCGRRRIRSTRRRRMGSRSGLEGVADTAKVRALIGQTGHLEFVLLPPETYGTVELSRSDVAAEPRRNDRPGTAGAVHRRRPGPGRNQRRGRHQRCPRRPGS